MAIRLSYGPPPLPARSCGLVRIDGNEPIPCKFALDGTGDYAECTIEFSIRFLSPRSLPTFPSEPVPIEVIICEGVSVFTTGKVEYTNHWSDGETECVILIYSPLKASP